jgi:hypothetical protein
MPWQDFTHVHIVHKTFKIISKALLYSKFQHKGQAPSSDLQYLYSTIQPKLMLFCCISTSLLYVIYFGIVVSVNYNHRVQSREDLAMWLCHQHNDVNEKIGKPLFHCNMKALDERWRQSSNPKCKPSH